MRSASVFVATTSEAVALLLAKLGSVVEEVTVTVSLIAVPAGVPATTATAIEKLAVPTAKLGLVQVMVPVLPTVGAVHDHPVGRVPIEKKVVVGGVTSVIVAAVAALGPELVTTCV
jgi:hypothetical protein